jgi:HSP20 family protein
MAEERQQQRPAQPDGRHQQPQGQQQSGQSTQAMQRRGAGQRRGFMPALFSMDPFDMFRTSPFALMRRFTEEMDHYFAQHGMGRGRQGMAASGSEFFSPAVEVFERDGTLTVRADLPGLTKDDVHVEITDDTLTIEGERRSEHEERQEGGSFRSECSYARSAGRFRCQKESMRTRRQLTSRMASWRSRCQRHNGRRVAAA